MTKIYGIDLGTTYSCIARVDDYGQAVVINNSEGQSTTPSVVFFETADNFVVGSAAKDSAVVHESHVVETVKRVMGDEHWQVEAFGQAYRPEEISAFILRKLVADASTEIGGDVTDVVITCPAYFSNIQRKATKNAGEIAGLNVHYVITEPSAAAIAYGMDLEEDKNIFVFDLGGGTFDVTIIAMVGGDIREVAIGGDDQLGGKDWDAAIVKYLATEFEAQKGVAADEVLDDPETYQDLVQKAEKAKFQLSSKKSVMEAVVHGGDRARIELTREKFEELTADLLSRTIEYTRQTVERGKEKGVDAVDTILLVGGSTYMPQVKERLQSEFPNVELRQQDPNQIVAKGAAIYGLKHQIDSEMENIGAPPPEEEESGAQFEKYRESLETVARSQGITLENAEKLHKKSIQAITSKSFGVMLTDANTFANYCANLVEVDDALPLEVSEDVATVEDQQEMVELKVFQNHHRTKGPDTRIELDDCLELGRAELKFERPLPKNSPVRVTFNLSKDGMLSLHGKDLTTNREVQAEFQTDSVMSSEEVESARERATGIAVS